MLTVDQITAWV